MKIYPHHEGDKIIELVPQIMSTPTNPSVIIFSPPYATKPKLPFGHEWVKALRSKQNTKNTNNHYDGENSYSALGMLSAIQARLCLNGNVWRDGDTSTMLSKFNPLHPLLGQLGQLPPSVLVRVDGVPFQTISGLNNHTRLTLSEIADVIERVWTLSDENHLRNHNKKDLRF